MVTHPGRLAIESNARLHHQEAARAAGFGAQPEPAHGSSLALHVDGWNNSANTAYQMHPNSAHVFPGPKSLYGKVNEQLAMERVGAKRAHNVDAEREAKRPREHGVRIDDLLNPVAGSAHRTALAAAHRMAVPSSLMRSRSDDSKHYYQQLVQLQLQLQLRQQRQLAAATNPSQRLARTATAPTERAAPRAGVHDMISEAVNLDRLYDLACVIIDGIWPKHSNSQRTQLCSLRCFVSETHRQSQLGVEALEMCLIYLLRAKPIIQAKERAERAKEEAQVQQQQQQLQMQMAVADPHAGVESSTPPLSPSGIPNGGADGLASVPTVVPLPAGGVAAVPSGTFTSPEEQNSPITPNSVSQSQVTYVGMDKQQLLASGMITPLESDKSKRALAGVHSLPSSFRAFAAAKPAVLAAPATAPAANPAADAKDAPAAKPAQKKQSVARCGRRMYVAALISASKFMYDQTYSNKAWNKVTKLPPRQICDMERSFLEIIDYRLYVDELTYIKFRKLTSQSSVRNGRMVRRGSGNTPQSPSPVPVHSPTAAHSLAPTPVSRTAPAPADLRAAMNVPISIANTPITQHPVAGATTSAGI
ncbi:PHO85 cyclin-5 [Coemansia erecta]|nr:PHO85 cyclin-5 [Coemansia sp. RSA 2618]KAJ2830756.1 PHO85 cyclin-5 [Coemansia erecta]